MKIYLDKSINKLEVFAYLIKMYKIQISFTVVRK
jgi:hypothetical protein